MPARQDSTVPKHSKVNTAVVVFECFLVPQVTQSIFLIPLMHFLLVKKFLSMQHEAQRGQSHLANSKEMVIKKGRRKPPRIVNLSPAQVYQHDTSLIHGFNATLRCFIHKCILIVPSRYLTSKSTDLTLNTKKKSI